MRDKLQKIQVSEKQLKYLEGHSERQKVGEVISCFLSILGFSAYKIHNTAAPTLCLHDLLCQILSACDCSIKGISEYTGHFARTDPVTSILGGRGWVSLDQMPSQGPFQHKLFCKSMSAYLLILLMPGIAQTHQRNGLK